mgnify:CR=1 FL=1
MIKFTSILFCIIAAFIWAPPNAEACSCAPNYSSISEYLEETDAVFEARVYKIKRRYTEFDVLDNFGKELPSRVRIYHENWDGGNCGVDFEKHAQGVLSAFRDSRGRLRTNSCMYGFSLEDYRQHRATDGQYQAIPNGCAVELDVANRIGFEADGKLFMRNIACLQYQDLFLEKYGDPKD